jgi:hypothetical protein
VKKGGFVCCSLAFPPLCALRMRSEMKAQFGGVGSWGHEVRPAESGQEVVKRNLVGEIDCSKPKTPGVLVAVQQVIVSNRDVKEMTRGDAVALRIPMWPRRPRCRNG